MGIVASVGSCFIERKCEVVAAVLADGSLTALAGDGPTSGIDGDGESGRGVLISALNVFAVRGRWSARLVARTDSLSPARAPDSARGGDHATVEV
jgi:hypothetical protein